MQAVGLVIKSRGTSHCVAVGAVACSSRLERLSSALGYHCAAGRPQRMAHGYVGVVSSGGPM